MANSVPQTCAACSKTPSDLSASARMLVCARCQTRTNRQTYYCSRQCQLSHWPAHKSSGCGVRLATSFPPIVDPSAPFQPPPALLFHLAALSTLPPQRTTSAFSPESASNAPAPPSFLYFPTSPTAPSSGSSKEAQPLPIPVAFPSLPFRNLFNALQLVAFRTGNPLSVNLLFSLLVTEVEALGGVEARLVEQLSEEYRLDGSVEGRARLREMLEEDEAPSEEELVDAIGGRENMGLLLEWQMAEAERTR
ncbi:hypothetical protein JCM1841_006280 [Sporobolomyces salmonicolor]